MKITLEEIKKITREDYTSAGLAILNLERALLNGEIKCDELKTSGDIRKLVEEIFPPKPKTPLTKPDPEIKPMFTARFDNPDEMEVLKNALGAEALNKAFAQGGGGMKEIKENLQLAQLSQMLRKIGDK